MEAGIRLVKLLRNIQAKEKIFHMFKVIYEDHMEDRLMIMKILLLANEFAACKQVAKKELKKEKDKDSIYYLLAVCSLLEGKKKPFFHYLSLINEVQRFPFSSSALLQIILQDREQQLLELEDQFPDASIFTVERKQMAKFLLEMDDLK